MSESKTTKKYPHRLRDDAVDLANELMGNGCIELGSEAVDRIYASLFAAYKIGKKDWKR